jgi:SAM-dependent methyltransferase
MSDTRRICDYEGTDYHGDFWRGHGRDYEDLAERAALRRLLPHTGRRLLDVGGAFGRLSEFYAGYDQAVIVDYSTSLLREAQSRLGRDGRTVYVAANVYALPFVDGAFDAEMMVRVIHHMEDVPAALAEIRRCLTGAGVFVLEFANKRHLLSVLRYALRRQAWSPFDPAPYEFVPMNFDFHPEWMRARLTGAGFHVKHQLTVSHFRLPLLKRLIPARLLAALDRACQPTGEWWQLTPSVFCQCIPAGAPREPLQPAAGLFRCPGCGAAELSEPTVSAPVLVCAACGRRWSVDDGIYDFKAPLPV